MHLEKLDLNLLVVIDALLRTSSVTVAATELNLTQSAVSSALKRARAHFEDEILFYDGQKMSPTPFGQSIAGIVPEMVIRLRALSRMRATTDLVSLNRQFTVIASDYVAAVFLSSVVQRLSKAAPGVSLAVVPFSEDSMDRFNRGKIDFMIGPSFWSVPDQNRAALFEDGFKCVLCKTNPLCETGLTLDAFLNSPHVLTNFFVGHGKSHFENWLEEQNFLIKVAASLPSFVVLPHYISGTANISTIHKRLLSHVVHLEDLVSFEPPCDIPPLTEHLSWKNHQEFDVEAKLMREFMLEIAKNM
ncbi:LysR family nod box-dependent transcriptional activator [Hoeflea halophila]|uniref:LysR family nod box-dependent transcriptional activator n=1 Tax=Hoeflea halophila TaxID=714899 RepID=A0A286IGF3_9HYPH|nr:LysR family transcriptional regulator [Hoeflea halophila]SOE18414.1 LysR family nod box-dependent transcriptional activator [Hoeflea halophila]